MSNLLTDVLHEKFRGDKKKLPPMKPKHRCRRGDVKAGTKLEGYEMRRLHTLILM